MKQRILVVEDEPAVARGVKDALSFNGYTVDVAVDGPSGYRSARDQAFDLIVLDLMLPGLDGLDVLARLRKDGCTAPILILTARGHEVDGHGSDASGAGAAVNVCRARVTGEVLPPEVHAEGQRIGVQHRRARPGGRRPGGRHLLSFVKIG